MARERGNLLYMVYRALTYGLSPLIRLHLRWRKLRGLEHQLRWPERVGRPSLPRPPGPLLWFHAVSLGEGRAAIPVIKCFVEHRPDINILMTTATLSAFEVIKNWLPSGVIYQFAPLDLPAAMDDFLGHWKPNAIVLMESELWPNLIMGASTKGIILALLNARMSEKSFNNWSGPLVSPLTSLLLSKFSLIAPLNTLQAIRFQLLQAPLFTINFSGDLKYAMDEFDMSGRDRKCIEDLRVQLAPRQVWMASSIHKGEEEVMLGVHEALKEVYPGVVMILVPRHPQHGKEIALGLQKKGVSVALRSHDDKLMPETSIYVVDTLGELRDFYKLTPVAVIGGSFLPNLAGHNISEASAAGCAVLTVTGYHIGHFRHMVQEMQRLNPLSVLQVSGKLELEKALFELFSNSTLLERHRAAARQAFHVLSSGIIENIWSILNFHVLKKALR
ncbi:probable 3-deoxy-D-manno-octulosonic acid transferase, mitochondrial isoform X2 [Diospyros lotus]|uniref:probable 3-deoxy-D-manno-octulosonic acid transferase, mitochondrial isoform X2 n=1 Tax=Diospyros lotus TaxID=55363 RepID=UPI00224CA827|nr:probable 3-deoxy-D-manno-octulosonic acid transferase, mitochondrial isoform X2 [Diospyros lotus]